MRLTYAVRLEDFRALQPPFAVPPRKTTDYRIVLGCCAFFALLGALCIIARIGFQAGELLIALGLLGAGLMYLYEKRSVRKLSASYEQNLAQAYQRLHCREQRVFATDDNSFTVSCNCGTVTRSWSELVQLSENELFFGLGARTGGHTIPKSAFSSEAEMTEFRALASSKLNQGKPLTSRHFDYSCSPNDYRLARRLHVKKAGGWRPILKSAAVLICSIWAVATVGHSLLKSNPGIVAGLAGGLIGVPLLRLLGRHRRSHYLGSLRLYFSEEGLYLQDSINQVRNPWSNFVGYLENESVLLLYYNPKLYRVIPKRFLVGAAEGFRTVMAEKLQEYDYRNPNPVPISRELRARQPA